MLCSRMLGVVVGLSAEARIAARLGYPVLAGGGSSNGAGLAATRLIDAGATALISFGLAGGLDPMLQSGAVLIPRVVLSDGEALNANAALAERFGGFTGHTITAESKIASSTAEKRHLYTTTQAHAIDLESGAVARIARAHGLPFIVVRAICDPAGRTLPPAALIALNLGGGIALLSVLRSVLAKPRQIPDLLAVARDAALARRALIRLVKRFKADHS